MANPIVLKGKDTVTDQETLHDIESFQSSLEEIPAALDITLPALTETPSGVQHTVAKDGVYALSYNLTAKADIAGLIGAKIEARLFKNGAFIGTLARQNPVFPNIDVLLGYTYSLTLAKDDVLDVRLWSSLPLTLKTVNQTFQFHKT
jgi:hypothetical protein